MKGYHVFFISITILFFLFSCKKDENTAPSIIINDANDQSIIDDVKLITYLESHFYNYEDFTSSPNDFSLNITIDTLSKENMDKIPLIDMVEQQIVNVKQDNIDIPHKLYYIIARQGESENPTNIDSTYVSYSGNLLDGTVFDSRELPLWFDLAQAIQGFRSGITNFKGGDYSINSDGTISFKNFGQGILFFPSGLAYFSNTSSGIPSYSPLVFSISLYTTNISDHDNDGVYSYLEDVDLDGEPLNDDTDSDGILNLYDIDDDGDGVLTKNELDKDNDGIIDDENLDGVPDYLDPNVVN
tara:strand:+ start:3873 stop:4769 length:897 start_codon:yes stop_codon:yes gene_type:complete